MTQLRRKIITPTVERFLAHCHRRRYPSKSVVIYRGDAPTSLYYIVEGSVAVLHEDDDGREIVLAYLNAGDFFGEMGLFDRNNSGRSAWVRSRTQCELAEINYDKFRQMATQYPDILFELATQMALRLRRTSSMVGRLAFMDVAGRVARTLLELCQQPDAMTHPDGMQIRITVRNLAVSSAARVKWSGAC